MCELCRNVFLTVLHNTAINQSTINQQSINQSTINFLQD
jgi:hypothetical protein